MFSPQEKDKNPRNWPPMINYPWRIILLESAAARHPMLLLFMIGVRNPIQSGSEPLKNRFSFFSASSKLGSESRFSVPKK